MALDIRTKPGRMERATNAQQRSLVRVYDVWAAQLRRDLASAKARMATPHELEMRVDLHLPRLEQAMLDGTRKGVVTAARMTLKREPPTPRVLQAMGRQQVISDALVKTSLLPGVRQKLVEGLSDAADDKALAALTGTLRPRAAAYAGQMWVTLFELQKAKGQDETEARAKEGQPPRRVRWVLDPAAEHCKASERYGCPDLEGEYESWDALPTVPAGNVTCLGSCRCSLEVEADNGDWVRGA